MIKNIIFDLDGTLINTFQEKFNKKYFEGIYKKFALAGYDAKLLSKTVLDGVQVMIRNDGSKSNEGIFWDNFKNQTNIQKEEIIGLFEDYYNNEYNELFDCVEKIEVTTNAISILKDKGYNLILATNPLFPYVAVEKRASWGKIDCKEFSYVTTYENSSYAKPNINYYKEIISNNNLIEEETMMFGNDLVEDLAIEKLNIPCFIITDNMLNVENLNNCTKKGNYNEFLNFVNSLPKIN